MKKLKNLKVKTALVGLAVLLSGCMNHEVEFSIGVSQAFVLQYGTGDDALFAPYISIYSQSHEIASATVTYSGETYQFSHMGNLPNVMDVYDGGYGRFHSTTTIPNGSYSISATSAEEGELATNGFSIKIEDSKKLGEIVLRHFYYTPSEGIVAEWDEVKNAERYGLILSPLAQIEGQQVLVGKTLFLFEDDAHSNRGNSGELNGSFSDGQRIRVWFAAFSSTLMPNMLAEQGPYIDITWGQAYEGDAGIGDPDPEIE